ncbi:hypothetical protein AB0J35_04955 [Nonomuraea angiospora]|uniref:hypothetical protein n=1 Tax=Nonomuraea angiospora TaxID=46172 RepID=UPI0034435959
MLLRLVYLSVTNTFAALRLLPMGDRDKDVEILALRHQITVLERQLGADTKARFAPEDRAFLAALLTSLPREILRRLQLLVRPDTVLRRHRDLMKRRHPRTCRSKRHGRPPTVRSIRALILRLVRENPETVTLNGQSQYILAVIEHAGRRIRVLGTTAHPTASWVIQAIRNLVMDLEDANCRARFLIRDRDGKFPALINEILADAGIHTALTGVRMPRMNSIIERWVQSCRHELLDRCLLWNERHLRHALREYELFYNRHRAHQP